MVFGVQAEVDRRLTGLGFSSAEARKKAEAEWDAAARCGGEDGAQIIKHRLHRERFKASLRFDHIDRNTSIGELELALDKEADADWAKAASDVASGLARGRGLDRRTTPSIRPRHTS